ncbi:hypothetical protein [Roseobacter sp.]|uniref:hypothetical protein n=1 Tax=Roseobacter sp. TaxID=1907202 RepID=UPI003299AC23
MDVILHIGAHRTGTKTFQDYLRRHAAQLAGEQVEYWGPGRTRRGLFSAAQDAGAERVQLQLAAARARGVKTLLISDENMMGSLRDTLRDGCLYASAGASLAHVARAFDGQLTAVVLSPRSLDYYWGSALAHGIACGAGMPGRDRLNAIVRSARSWRDVIADVAQAIPDVDLRVTPFERFAGRPEALLAAATGITAPCDRDRGWLNPAPTLPELRRVLPARGAPGSALPFGMDRWNPFTPEETAALREAYADDTMWLVAGADGLATLTEDNARTRAGQTLPVGARTKGHGDEHEKRQMARPG